MGRGELRIYLGAAPGVGKTFAMLNEGWRRAQRGTDVVIGYAETHGRVNTRDQLRDLEVVPRRRLTYRDQSFEEMDLDALLARRPDVALVDELAHTNVPGSRHAKRYEDVEELLAAGISVITTVNVQHLESLNDVVERITGITQRETVPDAVVRAADQIELVDMSPEALRRRMAHGNIYPAEKVDAALANYFRPGNLAALRELALLWVADRVEDSLADYRERHGITDTWETRERVVVALAGAPGAERLIRRGARLAARGGGELIGVHIRPSDGRAAAVVDQALLEAHRALLTQLGGRYAEATGNDVADALAHYARAVNATQLVLGATRRSRWAELVGGSVINRVISQVNDIDVHVLSPERAAEAGLGRAVAAGRRRRRRAVSRSPRATTAAWLAAVVGMPALVLALLPFQDNIGTSAALLVMLMAPVGVALAGGFYPAVTAAVVAFLFADWFYVAPVHRLTIARVGDALALVVFVAVAAVVSKLVDSLSRRTAEVSRGRVESEALARLAQGTAVLDGQARQRLVSELRATLGLDAVAVLSPATSDGAVLAPVEESSAGGAGWRVEAADGEPVPATPEEASFAAELAEGAVLVVAGPPLPAEDRRLLGAFVAQLGLAQATLRLQAEATGAEALSEANNLRDALLAAVSHDLRGPLANIKAAATSLLSTEVHWEPDDVTSFAQTIDAEADRLTGLIVNLLDMSRLQAGMLGVKLVSTPVDDVIWAALASLTVDTSTVDLDVSPDLPEVRSDPALLERVLANVVQNAIGWAPPGTRVRLEAAPVMGHVEIRVSDRGPGIPREMREAVFRPFQRFGDGGRDRQQGVGLGLAVAKGFAEATGAGLTVDDTPGGGATFVIELEVSE